jgi:hypothetical protein
MGLPRSNRTDAGCRCQYDALRTFLHMITGCSASYYLLAKDALLRQCELVLAGASSIVVTEDGAVLTLEQLKAIALQARNIHCDAADVWARHRPRSVTALGTDSLTAQKCWADRPLPLELFGFDTGLALSLERLKRVAL